jgi:hypothetical protein
MLSADKSMTEESPQTKKGFEPWAVFAAGKAAVQQDDFEEAVDLFSSVLSHLYKKPVIVTL